MSLKSYLYRALFITLIPLLGACFVLVTVFWSHLTGEARSRDLEVSQRVLSAFENSLSDQIKALQLLSAIPETTGHAGYLSLHSGASSFSALFGGHVILADTAKQMLVNTSVPFGDPLPKMPTVLGRSAFDIALRTGAPAIGDSVFGPVVGVRLIAVAVPVKRQGKTEGILLAINKLSRLQSLLDLFAGTSDYKFAIFDSQGNMLAASKATSNQGWGAQLFGARTIKQNFGIVPWRLEVSAPSPLADPSFLISCAILFSISLVAALMSLWWAGKTSKDIEAEIIRLLGDASGGSAPSRIVEIEDIRQRVLETQKEIQRVSLAKSQFLASMSHELRTPINAILGFGQMLSAVGDDVSGNKREEWIENIIKGGEHLLGVVNQILDVSLIEADQLRLSIEDVEVNELVKNCIDQMRVIADEKNVQIVDNLSGGEKLVLRTDPLRLRQILFNLLSNAIKFNRLNGRVFVSGEKTEHQYLKLYVTDSGCGIAESDRPKLFDFFSQVNPDPTVAKSGMGLGLAVSRTLAERLGGWLDFTSVAGKETVFWVSLPLKENHLAIVWDDEIRLGVTSLDEQHKDIFAMINKLGRVSLCSEEKADLISELTTKTKEHFYHEEVMMELIEFPDRSAHHKQHQKLLRRMQEFLERGELSPERAHLNEVHELLVKWWALHIKSFDTPLSSSIKGRELEIDAKLRLLGKNHIQ